MNYDDNNICSICIDIISSPITLKCNHTFCSSCISNYKKSINSSNGVNPCIYGAPRCPCNNENSCNDRPCCNLDNQIMRQWEIDNPYQFREWTIDESTSNYNSKNKILTCPMCRQEI